MATYNYWDEIDADSPLVVRLFGLTKREILKVLEPILTDVTPTIKEDALDAMISIPPLRDKQRLREVMVEVYGSFNQYLYADDDTPLNVRALEFLRHYSKRVGIAESITGGKIADSLIKLDGASEHVFESVVTYSNESKMYRLSVSKQSLSRYTAVSSQVAGEMVDGLLERDYIDVALAVTGYATSGVGMTKGLVYVGVGDRDHVEIYEHRFDGDREKIRRTAANAAIFHLIKQLKAGFDATDIKKE